MAFYMFTQSTLVSTLQRYKGRETTASIRVVSKTKHSKTKTEARSTQNSKTKHPNLENEAPYLENEAPKTRKRSTQISKTKHPISKTKTPKSRKRSTQNSKTKTPKSRKRKLETTVGLISATLRLTWRNPNQVEAADASAHPKVHKIHLKVL